MTTEQIKKLIEFILRFLKPKNKEEKSDSVIPNSDAKDVLSKKKDIENLFLVFKVGIPNLAKDDNTIKVRKFIDYEFKFDFNTVWLQCTEYVQYKILKELGIKIDWTGRVGPRDGAGWPEQFLKLKRYKVLDIPKKGCAMSFTTGCPVPPGHVAYVEDVLEDGSIRISEANWPPPGQKEQGHYNERPLTKKDWQDKYKGRFIDFS